ncbi:MAG TPA: hypothetical protein VD767_10925 [Thermomicrobiales bacterium]|nr:hypothetical protein [Thermomicrobiales bacterium]
MVIHLENPAPSFAGSAKVQALAERAFNVLRGRGMFMSDNTPIRVPMAEFTAFLTEQAGTSAAAVAEVLGENAAVFGVEEIDGVEYVSTTRTGRSPVNVLPPNNHTFAARFLIPEPRIERPIRPVPERPRVDPSWATYSMPDLSDEDEDEDEAIEDVLVLVEAAEELDVAAEVEIVDVVEVEEEPEVDIVEEPVVEVVAEPVVVATPAPSASDFSGTDDAELATALQDQLGNDARIAVFAGKWMAEDRVERLGRNDVRRIKDYISEQEQPLTDATLVQDILNVRPNSTSFETVQFSLNYRLFKDHRDFDFVGTSDQRFWSTSSLPQIGTTRRKPNEIGTDYRFLVDEVPAEVAHRSVPSVSRVLTFYEYSLGLLPYDEEMQKLLPAPVLPDQRSAVLMFEIPQLYTTYLVELRYPTPNRGGFILGLDDFYSESLVPGALLSITATGNDGHYKVEFLPGKDQNARLLDLDDRRAARYHFRPTTYSCEVAPEWLISEERFPRLGTERPLDDKVRRRPDAVVEASFERIGIEDGNSLISTFDELLTVVNIERPFSAELLRHTLEGNSAITSDGDTFTHAR